MCGIFGLIVRPGAHVPRAVASETLDALFRFSESRGKESAGVHAYLPASCEAWTLKGAISASELLKSQQHRGLMSQALDHAYTDSTSTPASPLVFMGHSRLVTNGAAERSENNQPVRRGGVTIIHNGIIVNVDQLWTDHPRLTRTAEVDTEVMAAMLADSMAEGTGPVEATSTAFARIEGAASVAWTHDQSCFVVLATNTGDLYLTADSSLGYTVFASERFILSNGMGKLNGGTPAIEWVSPGCGIVLDTATGDMKTFSVRENSQSASTALSLSACSPRHHDDAIETAIELQISVTKADYSLLRYGEERLRLLRRCTRCILPETFPFIEFDEEGVCNYCHSYRPRYKGLDPAEAKRRFIESLRGYRSASNAPDALVAFSGGRDSSYGLHLIKHEFGLNPITFTYDWGMVTDLARRNIARICGRLGVQNILVSADIKMKRDNIRKNVAAWLHKPDLGLVPLFMAGDKHFFRIANQLKRQTGIRLDLWCANPLENTDFKSGFCGVEPDFGKKRVDYLSSGRKLRMAAHYARHFLSNPRYLNSSLSDTFGAFLSYYVEPRTDFFFIFDHMVWNEDEVNQTLLAEYDWELARDTKSTWRIGDGTAPFYNYVYLTARGFSEFDTFRSNQIREGTLTREQALELVLVENRPRADSILWYLDTIGLDFDSTIRRINELDVGELHRI